MKNILTITALLLLPLVGLGQTVVTKTGTCLLTEADANYRKAVNIALDRAKVFAVSEVCGEDVSVFSLSRNGSFTVNYNVGSYGVVHVLDKVVERDEESVTVTMTGEVYRVVVPRAITVSGMDNVCETDEDLTFNISFHKKSYLKIFWFDEENEDGGILFNGRVCFNDDARPVSFPSEAQHIDYKKAICPGLRTKRDMAMELAKTGTLKSYPRDNREDKHVTILFVTTTHNMPFSEQKVTEKSFMDWWCELPSSEREMPEKRTITIKMM